MIGCGDAGKRCNEILSDEQPRHSTTKDQLFGDDLCFHLMKTQSWPVKETGPKFTCRDRGKHVQSQGRRNLSLDLNLVPP
jgi:hypothetical protein